MLNLKTGKHFTEPSARSQMTRGGFLRGILASGIAPSITLGAIANAGSANASVGGMMRNVGARNAAVFGGGNQYDYQVNYLENVGGQFIDSGYCLSNTCEILAKWKANEKQNYRGIYGCYEGSYLRYELLCDEYKIEPGFGGYYAAHSAKIEFNTTDIYELKQNSNGFYVNDVLKWYASQQEAFRQSSSAYIFNFRISSSQYLPMLQRFYYFKIIDNNVIVRDFIPVIKNETAYLYDKCGSICPLTGTSLYANAGTGAFTWG